MVTDRFAGVRVAKHVAHVLGDEPRLPSFVGQSAQYRALEIESLDFIAHRLFPLLVEVVCPVLTSGWG